MPNVEIRLRTEEEQKAYRDGFKMAVDLMLKGYDIEYIQSTLEIIEKVMELNGEL